MERRLGGFGESDSVLAQASGALQFIPAEGLAVDSALEGLEEDDGEELAVGKALQPDVEEEPAIAFVGWVAALEREGRRGGDKVDDHEGEEVESQLVEIVGRGGDGVIVAVDEIMDDAGDEHEVNEGRDERKQHLEDEDVGQGEEAHGLVADEGQAMLPDGLEDAEGPAEALSHKSAGVAGGLGEGQGAILVDDLEFLLEEIHGEVGVLGHGIDGISASGFDCGGAPCADGSGDDGDNVKEIKGAALEVLTGDVFEGLPAGP